MRRRYAWSQIATMARQADGVWRQHRDLVAVTPHLARHAARRVPQLRATPEGHFEFARVHHSTDDLGLPTFDLLVRWVPATKETP